jgi:Cu/Ag efflux protein CusF
MLEHMKGVIVAGLVLVSASCQRPAATRVFDVKGEVIAVDSASKTLELNQEEIPGYMEAMIMKYPVVDAGLLEGLKAGDSVQIKLQVGSRSFAITSLKRL